MYEGTPDELAVQQAIFTRLGVTRIVRYAFELARSAQKAADFGDEIEWDYFHDAVLG